jgi:hypothetical protein
VTDDIEPFILGWRLEVRGDRLELGVGGPGSAGRQVPAPLPELPLAQGVGGVHEMELMPDIRALEYPTEPGPLGPRIAGKVEHHGHPLRQERAHVWLERVLQSRGVLDELGDVGDLARVQAVQELVLHDEDRVLSFGQVPGEGGFPRRHLAAQEDQFRPVSIGTHPDPVNHAVERDPFQ